MPLLSQRSTIRALLAILCSSTALHAAPVELVPSDLHGALQPQVAVAPAGRIHVTFGKGSAIYHAASFDAGRTFTKPAKVGELPKLALGMRRGPRIVASDSVLAITAISHADGNLHAWASKDGGATWQAGKSINDAAKSAREGLHAMAGDGKGNAFVTWLDLRNGGMELWRATSADGGATWGANALVYKSPDGHICECCHPSAAMDGEGRVAVMWRNWLDGSRDMFAALSNDGGKTFAAAQKLGSGTWKLNGCPMDGGAITLDAAGNPLTAWRREKTVFASKLGGAEEQLADSAAQPIVVSSTSGAYEVWESGGGLMLKKGTAGPSRFAVDARFAAAAALPKGGAVIVWEGPATGKSTLLAEIVE
ncbi:MAG: sialidase family protein [Chthoniobacteraceae bacterium]